MNTIYLLSYDKDFNHYNLPVDDLPAGIKEYEDKGHTVWRAYKVLADGKIQDIDLTVD
jgi:hypothetical protein